MRCGIRVAAGAVGVMLAITPASSAGTLPVALTQTNGDLSQALTPLSPLHFRRGVPPRGVRVISVDDGRRFQKMQGFGAAMTDSSAWLIWAKLTPHARTALMRALFAPGPAGIAISYVRVPIGASDFTRAEAPYSYDDLPSGETDSGLVHFSIAHDRPYVLPALRAMRSIDGRVTVLASPWSPPPWMKVGDEFDNPGPPLGTLLPADYPVLASYFVRFLRAYAAAGVPVGVITPQNEPEQLSTYPGMDLTEPQEARFTAADLVPALRAAQLHPAILGYDYEWSCSANTAAVPCDTSYPAELAGDDGRELAGIAWHCYAGNVAQMSSIHALAPRLTEVVSECSSGISPGPPAQLEIAAARNWASAVVLWNIALDRQGGPVQPPNLGCEQCTGLAVIDKRTRRYRLGRDYYQLGQASRYVPPGSVRIGSNTFVTDRNTDLRKLGSYTTRGLDDVAFLDPNSARVLLTYNSGTAPARFAVSWRGSYFIYTLRPRATATFRWSPATPTVHRCADAT
jgi:glucosylceramidase